MKKMMTYTEAIQNAVQVAMEENSKVICFGLGADDPKRIFGTTAKLQELFGKERVFDTPTSENAMTGVGVGVAMAGFRPVMTHQRLDFFLLAMDQLVNAAAKWYYMFGGQTSIPIVIRLIIGRGWGQGPTHSQNLQAWFAHIPGLKVIMPTTPSDAKGMLIESIFDENPVLFLEHRWLHNAKEEVPLGDYRVAIDKAHVIRQGEAITIVSMSYMTIEALHAVDFLAQMGIFCELIDLRSIRPIDWKTLFVSITKTGHLLVLDTGMLTGSVSGEIVARVCTELFASLKQAPKRIAMPDNPEPTSFGLTKYFYPDSVTIAVTVLQMLNINIDVSELRNKRKNLHDVPGDWFTGPF